MTRITSHQPRPRHPRRLGQRRLPRLLWLYHVCREIVLDSCSPREGVCECVRVVGWIGRLLRHPTTLCYGTAGAATPTVAEGRPNLSMELGGWAFAARAGIPLRTLVTLAHNILFRSSRRADQATASPSARAATNNSPRAGYGWSSGGYHPRRRAWYAR